MPAAINHGIYYAIAANHTTAIHFHAADFDEWFSADISEIKKMSSWKNYVLSVVNEFVLLGKNISGFDCVFGGDIPRGSGMSSSAAVEGGLAMALNDLFGFGLDRIELALLCQRAEHNFPGVQCGIMDQFANMMGKKDQVILLDCKDLSYQYFPLQLQNYSIVLINSMVHHALAAGEYNVRRQQCEEGLKIISASSSVQSFRDIEQAADLLAYKTAMDELVYNRCLYVVEEIHRTKRAATLLKENNLIAFGKLMFETHTGLSQLYQVSCPELDFLVEEAAADEAVIGARLMGGGFGGCTINLVQSSQEGKFVETISGAYLKKFGIAPGVYPVATGDGTSML
jgi:galactokinase